MLIPSSESSIREGGTEGETKKVGSLGWRETQSAVREREERYCSMAAGEEVYSVIWRSTNEVVKDDAVSGRKMWGGKAEREEKEWGTYN